MPRLPRPASVRKIGNRAQGPPPLQRGENVTPATPYERKTDGDRAQGPLRCPLPSDAEDMPRLPRPASVRRLETALRDHPLRTPLVSRKCHACHALLARDG